MAKKGKGKQKVTLCHKAAAEDPEQQQTITVGGPAAKAHMAHGDTVGACPTPTPPQP